MKRIFLALTILALACNGSTKVNISDVAITFDSSCLILDGSTKPPTLRFNPTCAGSSTGTETVDELTAGAGQSVFTSSASPIGAFVDVYRNGLLQSSQRTPVDYTTTTDPSGRVTVSLSGVQTGDYVTLRYRR